MAMGKSIRVSGLVDRRSGYSLLVEQRGKEEGLMVHSNNTVVRLTAGEVQEVRATTGVMQASLLGIGVQRSEAIIA